jgi:flagellar protein FliS
VEEPMQNPYSIYSELDVTTANPLKVVLMLYDGAINFLKKAVQASREGDLKSKNLNANSARDIVMELNNALKMEEGGEIARSLRGLYFFMNRHIMQSNWKNDTKGFEEVIQLLGNLRDAWQYVHDQKDGVESSAPKVFQGFRA